MSSSPRRTKGALPRTVAVAACLAIALIVPTLNAALSPAAGIPAAAPASSASAAPPTGKLVYTIYDASTSNTEIWLVERNGTGAHKLTDGRDPSFSPDGKSVLFTGRDPVSEWDGFLYRIPVEGGERTRLSGPIFIPPDEENRPSWAHQGGRYAADQQSILHVRIDTTPSGDDYSCWDGIARTTQMQTFFEVADRNGNCFPETEPCTSSRPMPSPTNPTVFAYQEHCPTPDGDFVSRVRVVGAPGFPVRDGTDLIGDWTADGRIPVQWHDPANEGDLFQLVGTEGSINDLEPGAAKYPYGGWGTTTSGCMADVVGGESDYSFSTDGELVGWTGLGMAPEFEDPPSGTACSADHRGIWLANVETGGGIRQVVNDDNAQLGDIQCTPGTCLTGVVITKALVSGIDNPGAYPTTFRYAAGSAKTTLVADGNPFNPFPPTTMLRLPPGTHAITEALVRGWALTGISCTPAGSSDIANRSVSVTVRADDGLIPCTFTSTARNTGDPDPCVIDPSSCEPPPDPCEVDPASCEPPPVSCPNPGIGIGVTLDPVPIANLSGVKPYSLTYGELPLSFTVTTPASGALCTAKSNRGALPVLIDVQWDGRGDLLAATSTTSATVSVLKAPPSGVPTCSFEFVGGVENNCYLQGPGGPKDPVIKWSIPGFEFRPQLCEPTDPRLVWVNLAGCNTKVMTTQAFTFYVTKSDLPASTNNFGPILQNAETFVHEHLISFLPSITTVTVIQDPPADLAFTGDDGTTGLTGNGLRADIPGSSYISADTGSLLLIFGVRDNPPPDTTGSLAVRGDPNSAYSVRADTLNFEPSAPAEPEPEFIDGTLPTSGSLSHCLGAGCGALDPPNPPTCRASLSGPRAVRWTCTPGNASSGREDTTSLQLAYGAITFDMPTTGATVTRNVTGLTAGTLVPWAVTAHGASDLPSVDVAGKIRPITKPAKVTRLTFTKKASSRPVVVWRNPKPALHRPRSGIRVYLNGKLVKKLSATAKSYRLPRRSGTLRVVVRTVNAVGSTKASVRLRR